MTATVLHATSPGARIAYEEHGEGAPLLLIHGLGYGRWGWGPLLAPLAERYRVLAFDNRGIGASSVPDGPYSARTMAEDAVAVLEAAGVGRAHVVGTSLGGMVAQALAADFPERVDRLVLACTTPGGPHAVPFPEATRRLLEQAQSLEPLVALRRFVEGIRVGDVAFDNDSTSAGLFYLAARRFQTVAPARDQANIRPVFSKFPHDGASQSSRRPGHDNYFSFSHK